MERWFCFDRTFTTETRRKVKHQEMYGVRSGPLRAIRVYIALADQSRPGGHGFGRLRVPDVTMPCTSASIEPRLHLDRNAASPHWRNLALGGAQATPFFAQRPHPIGSRFKTWWEAHFLWAGKTPPFLGQSKVYWQGDWQKTGRHEPNSRFAGQELPLNTFFLGLPRTGYLGDIKEAGAETRGGI